MQRRRLSVALQLPKQKFSMQAHGLAIWITTLRGLALALVLLLVALVPAKATTVMDANGVLGWRGAITGGYLYRASPDAACQALWVYYAPFPHSTYQGATPQTSDWQNWDCHWTGVPYPPYVRFTCDTGYVAIRPGNCVLPDDLAIPQLAHSDCTTDYSDGPNNSCIANPVELSSGRKMEQMTDFKTNDGLLHVTRYYASRRYASGVLDDDLMRYGGIGWTFDFGPTLRLGTFATAATQTVSLATPDGSIYSLVRNTTTGVFAATNYSTKDAATRSRWTVALASTPPSNWTTIPSMSTDWNVTDTFTGTSYLFRVLLRPGASVYAYGYPITITQRGGYTWTLTYGSENEITDVTDSFGRSLSFTWLSGYGGTPTSYKILIDTIGLPDGTTLKYTYAPSYFIWNASTPISQYDRMEKVEHFTAGSPGTLIGSTTYHYEDGRFPYGLTGITDSRGQRYATWTYDGWGRVASSEHGSGADDYAITYAKPNSTTWTRTVTNPLGKNFVYTYNKVNSDWLLSSVAGQASTNTPASTVSYSQTGQMVSQVTDEEGRITRYARNSIGLPSTITEAYGLPEQRVTTLTWRSDRQLDLMTAPGLTTDTSYDSEGLLSSVTQTDTTTHSVPYSTNGQTRTWTYSYTTEGLLASVDGPLTGSGDTVTYAYDADGYLQSVTDQLGHMTQITSVDSLGRPLTIEDANGIDTELTYTPEGYLATTALDPTGANVVTTIGYDEVGDVTSITKADGTSYTYAYDAARRLTSITDAHGVAVNLTLDDMGNPTLTEIDGASPPPLFSQSATFDELGRLLTSVGAGSETWTYAYDKVSNLVSITDPRTGVSTQAFNPLNDLIETVDQATNTVMIDRDAQGQIATYADPRSIATQYVRNGWGEVIQESSPDIGTVVYERNALGLITKKTDARSIEADYAYDDAGRPTSVTYPGASSEDVAYSYDDTSGGNLGVGYLTGITDESGSTARVYNSLGLLASETLDLLPSNPVTSYAYDDAGNVHELTYPSGRIVTYTRNAQGEIETVTTKASSSDPDVTIADDITWQPFGGIAELTFGNSLTLHKAVDQNYRLVQSEVDDGATPLVSHNYSYGDALNLTGVTDNLNAANDESYSYTANNMLEVGDGPWGHDTFAYDGVGNITQHVNIDGAVTTTDDATYSPTANHMTQIDRNSVPARAFTYDAAGNIATDTAGGVTTVNTYNHADRLASFTRGGNLIGTYVYNADGQMASRVVTNTASDGSLVYIYDQDGHRLTDYNATTGDPLREYVWLGDTLLAVIDPASSPDLHFVHSDHIGRPIALSDPSGNLVTQITFLEFGGIFNFNGTVDIDLRFPGQYELFESEQFYNWHRTYDPTVGRYTQPDPLGLPHGPSRYSYALNNPLQATDASGLVVLSPLLFPQLFPHSSPPNEGGGGGICLPPEGGCPPCMTVSGRLVLVGTLAYRPLDTPSRPQHGIVGPHYNIYKANQNPGNCQCFWQEVFTVPEGNLPPGAIPIEPFVKPS